MAYLDDLKLARDRLAARLAVVSAEIGPDMSDQGRSVSWGSVASLSRQLKDLDEAIIRAEGAWWIRSYGHTV